VGRHSSQVRGSFWKRFGVAIIFGGIALGLTFVSQINLFTFIINLKEIIMLFGTALSGAFGGLIVTILAGVVEQGKPWAYAISHLIGLVFVGGVFGSTIKNSRSKISQMLIWLIISVVYYSIFYFPLYNFFDALIYEHDVTLTWALMQASWLNYVREAVFTVIITLILVGLTPEGFKKSLFGRRV